MSKARLSPDDFAIYKNGWQIQEGSAKNFCNLKNTDSTDT